MRISTILILALVGLVILLLAALIDSSLREGTEKYKQRKFELTTLELILYGLYFLFFFSLGVLIIYFGLDNKLVDNIILKVLITIAGFLFTINFILFLNHLFYELFQKIQLDVDNKKLTLNRMGKYKEILLDNDETFISYYKPINDKKYGRDDFQLFGAKFYKIIVSDGTSQIKISALNRIKIEDFIPLIGEERIYIKRMQIIFIY